MHLPRLARGFVGLTACAVLVWPTDAARAQNEIMVDLELVLAIDLSSSVDPEEFDLQVRGLSEAFRHPDLVAAIENTGGMGISVAVIHWSDRSEQALAVDWTLIRDGASAAALARKIRRTPRLVGGGQTGIGGAIEFSMEQFARNPYRGWRRTIDVSGDGRANSGSQPMRIRDRAVAEGVTINGLAIVNEEPFVDRYYRDSVIGGPGAFMMLAQDYEDFAASILRKLIREIGPPLAQAPEQPKTRFAAITRK